MKFHRVFLLIFYLLAAIIVGALIASACSGIPFLSWLSFAGGIGISPSAPFVLDLAVIQLSFGIYMSISVAQVFTIALAIFAFTRTRL